MPMVTKIATVAQPIITRCMIVSNPCRARKSAATFCRAKYSIAAASSRVATTISHADRLRSHTSRSAASSFHCAGSPKMRPPAIERISAMMS